MVKVLKGRMMEIPLVQIDFGLGVHMTKAAMKELDGLAQEIWCAGLRQPVMVRPKGERFELVVGIRRFLASSALDRKRISCVVADLDDKQCSIARAIHALGGLYLVLTPKQVVFSLGPEAEGNNEDTRNGGL